MSTRLLAPFARLLPNENANTEPDYNFRSWSKRIPHESAIEMLHHAIESSGDPLLGLHAAHAAASNELGWLSYAMDQSENLDQGMAIASQYARLLHDAAELRVDVDGGQAIWSFHLGSDLPLPEQAAAYVVGLMARYIRLSTREQVQPVELRLRATPPEDVAEFERVAGARVRFSAAQNGVVLDARSLEAPMKAANPSLRDELCQLGELLVRQLPETQRPRDRVASYIRQNLVRGEISATDVARHLGISERTLRRHLGADGTSYAELLDETRRELATAWLATTTRPIADIALTLGFSHVSSFYKAFRRWTGRTPVDYRTATAATESATEQLANGTALVSDVAPKPPPAGVKDDPEHPTVPPASAVRHEGVEDQDDASDAVVSAALQRS